PTGSPSGCHQPNRVPADAAAVTLRSSVTVSITVFLAGSARRKSPAVSRNPLVSTVMNQLTGPWFHLRRVGTDRARRTSGTGRGPDGCPSPDPRPRGRGGGRRARRGSLRCAGRRRRGHGLLPGQRGQRVADG